MNDDPLIRSAVEAVMCGRSDVVHSVLAAVRSSADLDLLLNGLLTKDGTLLHTACKLGHVDVLRVLLTAGASPETRNTEGKTALSVSDDSSVRLVFVDELFRASAESNVAKIKALLECDISVNITDCSPSGGNTPLHWAACYGTLHGLNCLLSCGADANMANVNGLTALHEAARRGDVDLISALLRYGGDPNIRAVSGDLKGKTPLDIMKAGKILSLPLKPQVEGTVVNGTLGSQDGRTSNSSLDSLSTGSHEGIELSMGRLSITPDSPQTTPAILPKGGPKILESADRIEQSSYFLWPQPLTVDKWPEEPFSIENGVLRVVLGNHGAEGAEMAKLWNAQSDRFAALGYRVQVTRCHGNIQQEGIIICYINPSSFVQGQSYRLIVSTKRVRIVASCCLGLWYCINRLFQFALSHKEQGIVPCTTVYDRPAFSKRGFHLEVSHGRGLWTVSTLCGHLDVLSHLNCNQFFLCLVLQSARDLEEDDLPYCHADLQHVEHFCERRQVEVVPGLEVAAEWNLEPEELPKVLDLMHRLLSCFCSVSSIHLGCKLSALVCRESLRQGCTTWNLLRLPPSWTFYLSVTAWNEELRNFPPSVAFVLRAESIDTCTEVACADFARTGHDVILSSPVSVPFGSITGHPELCAGKVFKAVQLDVADNIVGVSVVQSIVQEPPEPLLCFTWLSLMAFAGFSWNPGTPQDLFHHRLPDLLDAHVFRDEAGIVGSMVAGLASVESSLCYPDEGATTTDSWSGSSVHRLIVDPDSVDMEGLGAAALQQASRYAKECQDRLGLARPQGCHSTEVVTELKLATMLILYACRLARLLLLQGCNPDAGTSPTGLSVINVGLANLQPTTRTDLANRMLALAEQFRATCLLRNTPLGLDRTLHKFNTVLSSLLPGGEVVT